MLQIDDAAARSIALRGGEAGAVRDEIVAKVLCGRQRQRAVLGGQRAGGVVAVVQDLGERIEAVRVVLHERDLAVRGIERVVEVAGRERAIAR